jgi:hypothetical protein
VPVAPPERLLHTAKVFTNFLHCNSIPLPIPDTSLHTCCSDTVVDESKQQKNPQIKKDTALGDLQCKLQYMNGRGNLRGYALEAP